MGNIAQSVNVPHAMLLKSEAKASRGLKPTLQLFDNDRSLTVAARLRIAYGRGSVKSLPEPDAKCPKQGAAAQG